MYFSKPGGIEAVVCIFLSLETVTLLLHVCA